MKLQDEINDELCTGFSVATENITFSLAITSAKTVCTHQLHLTEHLKLFILQGQRGSFFKTKSEVQTYDLNIFNYVNSKFVYIERHIRNEMNSLYRDVLIKRCE